MPNRGPTAPDGSLLCFRCAFARSFGRALLFCASLPLSGLCLPSFLCVPARNFRHGPPAFKAEPWSRDSSGREFSQRRSVVVLAGPTVSRFAGEPLGPSAVPASGVPPGSLVSCRSPVGPCCPGQLVLLCPAASTWRRPASYLDPAAPPLRPRACCCSSVVPTLVLAALCSFRTARAGRHTDHGSPDGASCCAACRCLGSVNEGTVEDRTVLGAAAECVSNAFWHGLAGLVRAGVVVASFWRGVAQN